MPHSHGPKAPSSRREGRPVSACRTASCATSAAPRDRRARAGRCAAARPGGARRASPNASRSPAAGGGDELGVGGGRPHVDSAVRVPGGLPGPCHHGSPDETPPDPRRDRLHRSPGARRRRPRGRRVRARGPVGRALARGAGGARGRARRRPHRARRRRLPPRAPPRRGRRARCWPGPEGLVRLVAESDADLVLNAIVGSAGLGPTVVALTEGIDVALANKESLVVGGDLVMPLAEATGAQLIPVDSEHSALHQLIAGEPPGRRRAARDHRLRRPVPRPLARRARGRRGQGRAAPPDLGDGRQDHDRLGDAHEQGPRGDRGAPPVRDALRPHRRRRAPAVDRPRARDAVRRRLAGPPRPPRHARADRLRAAPPRARRRAGADARPRRRWAR